MMRLRTVLQFGTVAALAASGCERAPRPASSDSTATPTPPVSGDSGTASPSLNGWNAAAGPVLLVSGETPQSAAVVYPHPAGELADSVTFDESAVADARVDLFARVGAVGQGTVAGGFESSRRECAAWPLVRILPDEQVPSDATWTVALRSGQAVALQARSVAGMARGDSTALTKAVLRLASLAPSDPSQPFHGLPFSARTIVRFQPEPGVEALVSDVVRRISTEADPREEHTLIVAERDSGATEPYELVYHERTAGPEETVVASDALAILGLGPERRPTMVLSRDDGSGTVYALLERAARGQWRVRWTSAHAGC
jgi:hypothetical protein